MLIGEVAFGQNQSPVADAQTSKAASHGGLLPYELCGRGQSRRKSWHMAITGGAAPVRPIRGARLLTAGSVSVHRFEAVSTLHGFQELRVVFDAQERLKNLLLLLRWDVVGEKYCDEGHWLRFADDLQAARCDAAAAFEQAQSITGDHRNRVRRGVAIQHIQRSI